jgi:hypothetical protein
MIFATWQGFEVFETKKFVLKYFIENALWIQMLLLQLVTVLVRLTSLMFASTVAHAIKPDMPQATI